MEDSSHTRQHGETLVDIGEYLGKHSLHRQDSCREELDKKQSLVDQLSEYSRGVATDIEEILKVVDSDYEQLKSALLTLLDTSKERFRSKALGAMGQLAKEVEEAKAKLSGIKTSNQLEAERLNQANRLLSDLESGAGLDDAFFIGLYNCVNIYMHEEKLTRALFAELEEYKKTARGKKFEMLGSLFQEHQSLQREDLRRLEETISSHFDVKKRADSKQLFKGLLDNVFNSDMESLNSKETKMPIVSDKLSGRISDRTGDSNREKGMLPDGIFKFVQRIASELKVSVEPNYINGLLGLPSFVRLVSEEFENRRKLQQQKSLSQEKRDKSDNKRSKADKENNPRPKEGLKLQAQPSKFQKENQEPIVEKPVPLSSLVACLKEGAKPMVPEREIESISRPSIQQTVCGVLKSSINRPETTNTLDKVEWVLQKLERIQDSQVDPKDSELFRPKTKLQDLLKPKVPSIVDTQDLTETFLGKRPQPPQLNDDLQVNHSRREPHSIGAKQAPSQLPGLDELGKEYKLLRYGVTRSYKGESSTGFTPRGLAEGTDYCCSGYSNEDWLQFSLSKDTPLASMWIEPPRLYADAAKNSKRLDGAEVVALRDDKWVPVGRIDLSNRTSVHLPLGFKSSAIRIIHGHKIDCCTSLGVGRVLLLG